MWDNPDFIATVVSLVGAVLIELARMLFQADG